MEGRAGGGTSLPHNKGATLPGYRVGSVRYGVRLAPQDTGSPTPTRRCSEGDVKAPHRVCVSEREPGAQLGPIKDTCGVGLCTRGLPPVDTGPTELPRHLGNTALGLPESASSPLLMKEAHSLLHHKRVLTVPSSLPQRHLSASRPHASRRSFNASPRPWVAPTGQTSVSADADDNGDNGDKNGCVGGRWREKPKDGVNVHPRTDSNTAPLKLTSQVTESPSGWGCARPVDGGTTFRSEATILVTRNDDAQGSRSVNVAHRTLSPLCRRRGVGTLSLAQPFVPPAGEEIEGVGCASVRSTGSAEGDDVVVTGLGDDDDDNDDDDDDTVEVGEQVGGRDASTVDVRGLISGIEGGRGSNGGVVIGVGGRARAPGGVVRRVNGITDGRVRGSENRIKHGRVLKRLGGVAGGPVDTSGGVVIGLGGGAVDSGSGGMVMTGLGEGADELSTDLSSDTKGDVDVMETEGGAAGVIVGVGRGPCKIASGMGRGVVGGSGEDEKLTGVRCGTEGAGSGMVTGVGGGGAGGAALVEEVRAGGLAPPAAKYTCCVAGGSPRQLVPRHTTMFSYPGPARPAIPEEPASAHLTSDQCSASPPTPPSHAHGSTVQCAVSPVGGSGSVASGGSGHGDRVAPPAPVIKKDNYPGIGGQDRATRKLVRPKPEVPDHLYRRWAALLPCDVPLDHRKQKVEAKRVGKQSNARPPGGGCVLASPDEVSRTVTSPDLSPQSAGPLALSAIPPESHLDLFSFNGARFQLGAQTAGLGGGRKEGGRGPPPARPPRSRQDHLEKLRKCTERLKTPSPDKKARAESAPPPDVASGGVEGGALKGKLKNRNNEVRSALTRHPSLGKSPSLPPQLPSSKEEGAPRLSHIPTLKEPRQSTTQPVKQEGEDSFNEGNVKLPPRPETRLVITPRVIPFRSASVSQVDVASDGTFSLRSGKSPTAIRLYPICKDYWGANTLPRRKPAVVTTKEGSSEHRPHAPLTTAASISDMTNVGAKMTASNTEKLENKSKSESELSGAGLNSKEGGSPKVDLLAELRLPSKKTEPTDDKGHHLQQEEGTKEVTAVETPDERVQCSKAENQLDNTNSGQVASEGNSNRETDDNDKQCSAMEVVSSGGSSQTNEKGDKCVRNAEGTDDNKEKIISKEVIPVVERKSSDSKSNSQHANLSELERLDPHIEGSSVTEGLFGVVEDKGNDVECPKVGCQSGREGAERKKRLWSEKVKIKVEDTGRTSSGEHESVGEDGSLSQRIQEGAEKRWQNECEAVSGEDGGDVDNVALSGTSAVDEDRELGVIDIDIKCDVGENPPGGEAPTPRGLAPPGDVSQVTHLPQGEGQDTWCISNTGQSEGDEHPLTIKDSKPNSASSSTTKAEGVIYQGGVDDTEGGQGHCTDRRQIECQVLEKEPRLSQCLVIKSGTGERGEVDSMGGQGATSECRVVRSRPRLPREDSDGDSGERDASHATYTTQMSDEGIFEEEIKSPEPRDSSDSSSQDSVGVGQDRSDEGIVPGPVIEEEVPVRSGSRRRRKLTEEGTERSLTFPPPRKGSQADSIGYSSVDSNGLRSLATSGGYGERGSSEEQRSSFSLADSYLSETSQPSDTHQLMLISDPRAMDRAERKKKHHSDPSCERRGSTDALLYLSEPHLGNPASETETGRTSNKGVVSQTSTDSEGRDERGEAPPLGPHRVCTPQVLFSEHESDGSDYPHCRTPARNASPIPYLQDSDSGERSAPRSPHGPRRYNKRPLRGPWGQMLEVEMSKSKPNPNLLGVHDGASSSPRPTSPASPAVMEEGERPPLISPTTRSFDDSAININYVSSPDRHLRRKISSEANPRATSPTGACWESDGEGTLTPLPIVAVHQRTASSPSKLISEAGFTSEDEQELGGFLSSTGGAYLPPRLVPPQNRQPHRQQQQQQQDQEQQQQQHQQQVPLPQQGGGEAGAGEGRHPPTHEQHRHAPDHRHSHKRHNRDTRAHVVVEIHDTERNYVENLNFLLTKYQQTLKSPEYSAIIDANLVDDIFFQVPEIHGHHERFLEEMKHRMESRDASICVGDIFLQLVNDPGVVESYTAFTNNWKTAQEATKAAAQAKATFTHFLVALAREHPRKLDLKALLIKPVQRFPQYELLLKRLLKHTSRDHPDHALVTEAIGVVQQVAGRINAVEQEALQHEQQQLLLKELENIIEGLVGLVQPDRTFLRHDLVVMHSGMGTRKERCLFLFSDLLIITTIKKRSGTIRKGSGLPSTLLSSLESNKFKLFKFIPLDDLEIARSHDESVKKLIREIETLEEDHQTLQHISKLTKNLRCPRAPMEEAIQDMITTVQKQLTERQGAGSQFMELELTITTQEGMENLIFMFNSAEKRALWEEAFNDAKHKLAMSADRRPPPEFVSALPIRKTRAGLQFTCAAATLGLNAHNLKDVWVCNSDGYVGQVCVLSLQPDPTVACCNGVCNARILSIASIPAAPHPDSSDDDDEEEIAIDEDLRKRRSESLPPEMGNDDMENHQPTMWLGTEDGFIHVYNCSDTIRIKKNKFKFQPGSPVHCIIHIDNRVFASLANGDIIVYRRDLCGGWNVADRQVISISTAAAPVTRMIAVAGKLWCAAMNTVRVLNTSSLQMEHSFVVGEENGRGVSCMVSAGHGVWLSVHTSSTVKLYHAATYECLCEVNVAPAVTKMLAGCDDIIRQHKAACLRVTSLLACKDLLWVGTSAGVIITVPLPHLAHNTHRVQAPLNMVGIPHGHTGHVRFLTSVELTPESRPSRIKSHSRYSFKGKDHPHHQPGTAAPAKLLVISGGDGYEDFRSSGMMELAGRDDSTNHLLLWQV